MIKSRILRRARHVPRMKEGRITFKMLISKAIGKGSLCQPRRRWEEKLEWMLKKQWSIGLIRFRIGIIKGLL